VVINYTRIMKKKVLTPSEFAEVVNQLKGCQFASISYVTPSFAIDKKLIGGKKNPYNGEVSSITAMTSVQIGASYENAVNNRTDEDFKAEKLPWGEWLRPNYLIGHKGTTYLRAYKTKATKSSVSYYKNGELVEDAAEKDNIVSNIRKSAPSARQNEVGINKENMVMPFNVNIENIRQATINGTTYIIAAVV